MGLLLPDAEGIYRETMPDLYDPAMEAYRETRGLAHDGEAWREVWPGKHIQILYDAGQFYMGYTLANSPWKMLPHSFDSTCISTTYPGAGDYSMIIRFAEPIKEMSKVCVDVNYLGGHNTAAGYTVRVGSSAGGNELIPGKEHRITGLAHGEHTVEIGLDQTYEGKYLTLIIGYLTGQTLKIWTEA